MRRLFGACGRIITIEDHSVEGIGFQHVGIAQFAPGHLGYPGGPAGVIGHIPEVPVAPDGNAHRSGRLQNTAARPVMAGPEIFLIIGGGPGGAVVGIEGLSPQIQKTALVRQHIHDGVIQLLPGADPGQIHFVLGNAGEGEGQQAVRRFHHKGQVPEPAEHGLLEFAQLRVVAVLRHGGKQHNAGHQHRDQQNGSQADPVVPVAAADRVCHHHQQQRHQKQKQREHTGDGICDHHAGKQGQKADQNRQQQLLFPAQGPGGDSGDQAGDEAQALGHGDISQIFAAPADDAPAVALVIDPADMVQKGFQLKGQRALPIEVTAQKQTEAKQHRAAPAGMGKTAADGGEDAAHYHDRSHVRRFQLKAGGHTGHAADGGSHSKEPGGKAGKESFTRHWSHLRCGSARMR